MPHIIIACCILHNYVEKSKQPYHVVWDEQRAQAEQEFPQPCKLMMKMKGGPY